MSRPRFLPLRVSCLHLVLIGALLAQSNPIARANQPGRFAKGNPTALILAQVAPAAQKSVVFAKPLTNSSVGPEASSVVIGDLNSDGKLDMVVASACQSVDNCNGEVSVLLGNGDGTFQSGLNYSPGGIGVGSIALGDLNADGKLDLVITTQCPNYSCVSVLLGNGDGTFRSAVGYYSGGYGAQSAAIGDINGDGIPDLVVSNACPAPGASCQNGQVDGSVGVLLGNGDGTFQSPMSYDAGAVDAHPVALGDLNGDGSLDVVVGALCPAAEFFNGCIAALLGNGDGTFQTAKTFVTFQRPGQVTSVAMEDVNGDGNADLVVSDLYGGVGVLLGSGDGTFHPIILYDSGGAGGSSSIAVGDVNGDGHPDLVVTNDCRSITHGGRCAGASNVGVLLGKGDGTFQAAVSYNSGGSAPTSVAIADLNGDGKPDLVVANECPSSGNCDNSVIGVLLNKSARAATTTGLTSSPNPSQVNQQVTFTATITSSLPIPDGQVVVFYNGTAKIGTSATTNGVARLTTSFSKAKTYTIRAKYAGGGFLAASSGTVKQVVNP